MPLRSFPWGPCLGLGHPTGAWKSRETPPYNRDLQIQLSRHSRVFSGKMPITEGILFLYQLWKSTSAVRTAARSPGKGMKHIRFFLQQRSVSKHHSPVLCPHKSQQQKDAPSSQMRVLRSDYLNISHACQTLFQASLIWDLFELKNAHSDTKNDKIVHNADCSDTSG